MADTVTGSSLCAMSDTVSGQLPMLTVKVKSELLVGAHLCNTVQAVSW